MRVILLLMLGLCAVPGFAQKVLTADASLSSVRVYRSGVEMNHEARVSLPAGSSQLVVGNVAGALIDNTIQVGANANVTILSVTFSKNYLKPEIATEARTTLEDSLKKLDKKLVRLRNESTTDNAVLRLLETNAGKVGDSKGLSVAELMRLTDYYKTKQNEVRANITRIDEEEDLLDALKDKISAQLSESSDNKEGPTGVIILQVMARNAASTNFKISYVSPAAAWSPFYDLRADKTSEPLKLAYKANVVQNTGLDWKQVSVTLSTGSPTVNGTAPGMSAWYLKYVDPPPVENALSEVAIYGRTLDKRSYVGSLTSVTAKDIARRPIADIIKAIDGAAPGVYTSSAGGQPGSTPDVLMRGQGSVGATNNPLIVVDGAPYSGDLNSLNPNDVASINFLKDAAATAMYGSRGANGVILITTKNKTLSQFTEVTENELQATFDVAIPYDIASNNKPHSISLQDYELPVHYRYFAIPKMDQDAFLMAHVTGYDKLNLLPGLANVIFENVYVGNSFINPGVTTDTLPLSMGRDKKIIIKREKVAELSGLKSMGSSQKQTFTYEIKVRNGKQDAIELQLKDQIPVSTEKDLEIELLESEGASIDKESGMLTWNLRLAAGQSQKIRFSYTIKHPTSKPIANL